MQTKYASDRASVSKNKFFTEHLISFTLYGKVEAILTLSSKANQQIIHFKHIGNNLAIYAIVNLYYGTWRIDDMSLVMRCLPECKGHLIYYGFTMFATWGLS